MSKKCLEAGGGRIEEVNWGRDIWHWKYCYLDDTAVNECLPNPAFCEGYTGED